MALSEAGTPMAMAALLTVTMATLASGLLATWEDTEHGALDTAKDHTYSTLDTAVHTVHHSNLAGDMATAAPPFLAMDMGAAAEASDQAACSSPRPWQGMVVPDQEVERKNFDSIFIGFLYKQHHSKPA